MLGLVDILSHQPREKENENEMELGGVRVGREREREQGDTCTGNRENEGEKKSWTELLRFHISSSQFLSEGV